MNKDSVLFWSHIKMYDGCPQRFLWTKGWDNIDLGNGLGKPKVPTIKSSRHHAIMGIAIHHAIEVLYNDELWREGKVLSQRMGDIAVAKFNELFESSYIDLENAGITKEEMQEVVLSGARGYVQTLKKHKLLGKYAKAEQKIISWIDKWSPIGGIIDVIIRRDDVGILILDGKNAQNKENVDTDQLIFYALVFNRAYRKLPQKLGVVWFRYPYSEDTGEEGITWVNFSEEDLKRVAEKAKKVKHDMYKQKFTAKPSRRSCMFCDFRNSCKERKEELDVAEITGKGSGFSDFSL